LAKKKHLTKTQSRKRLQEANEKIMKVALSSLMTDFLSPAQSRKLFSISEELRKMTNSQNLR